MIYEFITPSDPITFEANNNQIAFYCSVFLGNGKAGYKRQDGEKAPSSFTVFMGNTDGYYEEILGMSIDDFTDKNLKEIGQCFKSFSYGDFESRQSYNDAIQAITDQDKLMEFKEKHEDRNRSSMSEWVKAAWQYGERFDELALEAA